MSEGPEERASVKMRCKMRVEYQAATASRGERIAKSSTTLSILLLTP